MLKAAKRAYCQYFGVDEYNLVTLEQLIDIDSTLLKADVLQVAESSKQYLK